MRVGSEQRHAGLLAEALRSTAHAGRLDAGRAVSHAAADTYSATGSQRCSSGWKSSEGSQHLLSEVRDLTLVSVLLQPRRMLEQFDVAMLEKKKKTLWQEQNLSPHGFQKELVVRVLGRSL